MMTIGTKVKINIGRYKGETGVIIGIYGDIYPFHYLIEVYDKQLVHRGDEISIIE